ncbi:hypothetical protein NLU13_3677 [Sarocladium strictum]|uniref:Uncharacterized protein n=1 Tax=Sarocladium strictum TaxID=5046 RepID=A0AA39GN84_SARSR|nr:hypothetical protein NLU13_3677 [Sarocladium strictum]
MKLTTLLVSAVMALGVAGVDPEAGNDVEVLDFSGENVTEFDARDEEDLEARTDYNKCGWGAYERQGECYCTNSKDYDYDEAARKCVKKLRCKGENVKVEVVDYNKVCKCTRTGEEYNSKTGCACKNGEEYSEQYKKCIPTCEHGEASIVLLRPPLRDCTRMILTTSQEYNPTTGNCEKPFTCKGNNVDIVTGADGKKSCKCKDAYATYNERKGCRCNTGYELSWPEKKCVPTCGDGAYYEGGACECKKHWEVYNETEKRCEKPLSCEGKNVTIASDAYGKKYCKCELEGQVYNKGKGCQCKHGEEYSEEYKKCIPDCPYGKKYNGKECAPICKGDDVIYKQDQCKCTKPSQYYDETYGCKNRCDGDATYDWHKKECKCSYGKDYVKGTGCVDKCIKPAYFKKDQCVCPAKDQYYKEHVGCKDRCEEAENTHWNGHECVCDRGLSDHGGKCVAPPTCEGRGSSYFDTHSWKCACRSKHETYVEHKGCAKKCGPDEELEWGYGGAKCVCKDGYKKTKWGCQEDGY